MTVWIRNLFALLMVSAIATAGCASLPPPKYDRKEWKHWTDVDNDCQNTRQEVLVANSLVEVEYVTNRRCRVAKGQWFGVYTAKPLTDLGQIHIDHLVPLRHAHYAGGFRWDARQKAEFANDEENLLPVNGKENMSKGSKGPDEYRPPNRAFWCVYATKWIHVKEKYQLEFSDKEKVALNEMIAQGCKNETTH